MKSNQKLRPKSAPQYSEGKREFNVIHPRGTFKVQPAPSKPVHVFKDPVPPTNNSKILTFHEKMFYFKYFVRLKKEITKVEEAEVILDEGVDDLPKWGHTQKTLIRPTSADFTNYVKGKSSTLPLRVVAHTNSGLLYNRSSFPKSHVGVARNIGGGYYGS
jgi:hypothetical protein